MFCQSGSELLDNDKIMIWGAWRPDPVFSEGKTAVCEHIFKTTTVTIFLPIK